MTVIAAHNPTPLDAVSSIGKKEHDSSVDGVRLVATLMVLLIHISGKGFSALVEHWWAVNTYESVSRICVPLFFMVTGALLLPRSHSFNSVLKRVWRVGIALVAWSIIYILYYRFYGAHTHHWIATILRQPFAGHMWYLYTLIPVYFLIPILAAFFVSASRSLLMGTLVVWFVIASLVPFINRFAGATLIGVDVAVFYIYPGYVLAGALLYRVQRVSTLIMLSCVAGWMFTTALTAFFTWFFSKDAPVNTEIFYEYFAPWVVLSTVCAFVSVREMTFRLVQWQPALKRGLKVFGELSFGIYLVHPMIIWEFEHHGYDWHFINPWFAIPCVLLGVVAVSGVVIWALKKIPYLRGIVPG